MYLELKHKRRVWPAPFPRLGETLMSKDLLAK